MNSINLLAIEEFRRVLHGAGLVLSNKAPKKGSYKQLAKIYRALVEGLERIFRDDLYVQLEEVDNPVKLAQSKIGSDHYNIFGENKNGDWRIETDSPKILVRRDDLF